jgi:hypothetical protein
MGGDPVMIVVVWLASIGTAVAAGAWLRDEQLRHQARRVVRRAEAFTLEDYRRRTQR